jgi:hypothetical protein
MTGQVKEDILSRFGELGVVVENGILQFNPAILRNEEFLQHPEVFEYVGVTKQKKSIELEKDSLAFTYCQVPVVYKKSSEASIEVQLHDGTSLHFKGNQLDKKTSTSIFKRDGKIIKLTVFVVKE